MIRIMDIKFANPDDYTLNTLYRTLTYLKIKVTKGTLKEALYQHPDFPSLLSISDTLKTIGIDNLVARIDKQKLSQVKTPFLLFNEGLQPQFKYIIDENENEFFCLENKGRIVKEPKDLILENWNGITMFLDVNKDSGEKDFNKKRKLEVLESYRIPGILLLFFMAMVYVIGSKYYVSNELIFWNSFALLLIVKFLGLIVTLLLLLYEIDKSNSIVKKICSSVLNANANCNAVLSSKGSKIFNWISWSEVGFVYFSGSFLYLLLIPVLTPLSLSLIVWLNLLALPFIVFSIYYQWKIVKQWCVLCLGVQALLAIELLIAIFSPLISSVVTVNIYEAFNIYLFIAFLLPALFWYTLKPNILKAKDSRIFRNKFTRLKMKKKIYDVLTQGEKKINVEGIKDSGILIGDLAAENLIIMVCNPHCEPCAAAHLKLVKLMPLVKNLKLQIIFIATNNFEDIRSNSAKHLLAIASNKDDSLTKQALHDWYSMKNKNYSDFKTKYPVEKNINHYDEEIDRMRLWAGNEGINYTPAIYVNGYELSAEYIIEDLAYLLLE